MELITASSVNELAVSLTTLAIKGTASAIHTKIKAIKDEKTLEKVRETYDEIISELLTEREEAIRIAQAYKSELDMIVISDDDIMHLQKTVRQVLDVFQELSPDAPIEQFKQLQDLINIDTLKALQLLGFNFKAAIGVPLTQLLAEKISTISKPSSNQNRPNKR